MSQSLVTSLSAALLDHFAKEALPVIVNHVNEKKGQPVTVQELCELLKLAAPSPVHHVSAIAPRVTTSFMSSIGPAPVPGVAPPSGKGRRGARSKKELAPYEICLYRARGEGKRCDKAKEVVTNKTGKSMVGFCKSCSDKAAGVTQYDTYISRGLTDDAIMALAEPFDKEAFTASKSTGGRKPKSSPSVSGLVELPPRGAARDSKTIITSQQTSSDGRNKTASGIVYMNIDGKAVCIGSTLRDITMMTKVITKAQKQECDQLGYQVSSDVSVIEGSSTSSTAISRAVPLKAMQDDDDEPEVNDEDMDD